MRIEVEHETRYDYDAPVRLGPHLIRLRPRLDGGAVEQAYQLDLDPLPSMRLEGLDAAGNRITRLWFDGETRHLRVTARLRVDTGDGQLRLPRAEPEQQRVPLRYEAADAALLAPYLSGGIVDPALAPVADELTEAADGDALAFAELLSQRLHTGITREIRPSGAPQTPARTLARGACRDQAVLFIALCRAVGLAARFVSGYQDRSAMDTDRRHLHAWSEVYLPGSGWHGWDPSRGTAVVVGHVAVAAAPQPAGTLPVEGSYFGDAGSSLDFRLEIRTG